MTERQQSEHLDIKTEEPSSESTQQQAEINDRPSSPGSDQGHSVGNQTLHMQVKEERDTHREHTSRDMQPLEIKPEMEDDTSDDMQPLDFSIKKPATGNTSSGGTLHSDGEMCMDSDASDKDKENILRHREGSSFGNEQCQSDSSPSSSPSELANAPQSSASHGAPSLSSPPYLAGFSPQALAAAAAAGIVPPGVNPAMLNSLPLLVDPLRAQSGKAARPFKAYPKDPLSLPLGFVGIPGVAGFSSPDNQTTKTINMSQEEMIKQYRASILKGQTDLSKQLNSSPEQAKQTSALPDESRGASVSHSSPIPSNMSTSVTLATSGSPDQQSGITSTTNATSGPPSSRRRPRALPEEQKDSTYWERRRKNNEAAKRSRDARRAKEDEIAIRAALLEQENLRLKVEVAALKNEINKLRYMLVNN